MKHPSKITLLLIGLLIVSSYSILTQAFSAAQQDLDWYAEPLSTVTSVEPLAFSGYTPSQIKSVYNLPASGGEGMTIAVIIAYHTANIKTYLQVFSQTYGLPLPTDRNFEVHKMATSIPTDSGWSLEACLDVEWAHAIAPNATILLVEAVSNSGTNLVNAINYATARSDVDVVTMSWGTSEFSGEASYDYLFDYSDIGFFAASGDNGSVVMWPSVSSNVVAVGGTRLNIDSSGTVTSETAWSGSGGGISLYEPIPQYQTDYGLTGSTRLVPDVAYNGDSSTGVRVYYNSGWYIVGGTSAGSPQWAGIYALGQSATHENLYSKSSTAYAAYFRDITSGSTTKYNATTGYDYITGLGSPLTYDFLDSLEVSPTYGGAGTAINVTGIGLSGTQANITYLNPLNSTWLALANNTAITLGSLTCNTYAPDLMGTIAPGENPMVSDQIIFQVTTNTGHIYNNTISFNEYRRGISQVGNLITSNIYGNNTTFGTAVLPQNGNSLVLSGKYFTPSNVTLLWDSTTLDNITVDQTGTFNTSITIPTTTARYHTLTIQDNIYNFTINIATQPTLSNNYDGQWKTSDFTVGLSADSTVDEIYYRINDGDTQNVTTSGQPIITSASANNTLEYWCNWTLNGVSLETAHMFLVNIMLDKTAPTGQVMASSTSTSRQVTLHLSAMDIESGVTNMCFSNDGSVFSSWEPYATTATWTLTSGSGVKMVVTKFLNGAGSPSLPVACEITLVPDATTSPQASTITNPTIAPQATQSSQATNSPTDIPTVTPIPEFPFGAALVVLALVSLLLVLVVKKRQANMHQ
jgi:hypothetical protein